MVRHLVCAVLAGCLSACAPPDAPIELPAPAEIPPLVAPPAALPAVAEPEPTPAAPGAPVPPQAIALVVAFEIVSPDYYRAHLLRPIWPGGASGATVGVGYDLGHQIAFVIRGDWREHAQVDRLVTAAGVKGEPARALTIRMRDVETRYPLAEQVFREAIVPRYWQATARAFPGVDELDPGARGALFSLVYNRGTAMAGAKRAEMRAIRDRCIPAEDYECIAEQILAMRRLWRGTTIEAGMNRRREAEAALVVQQ